MGRYLIYFAESREGLAAFRVPELTALSELYQIPFRLTIPPVLRNGTDPNASCGPVDDPTQVPSHALEHTAELPEEHVCCDSNLAFLDVNTDDEIRTLVKRSVSLHNVSCLLAEATTLEHLCCQLKEMDYERVFQPWMGKGCTFKLHFEAIGQTVKQAEKEMIYSKMCDCFPHEGSIDIKQPRTVFWIYAVYDRGSAVGKLKAVYFGRLIAGGARSVLTTYALSKRPHIGTTSMPPELTFLMSNIAKVSRGSVVLDCFCGTGSTLLSAAHHGASVCMGADRDARTMRGLSPQKKMSSIYENFRHYGLDTSCAVDLLRLSSEQNMYVWREGMEAFFTTFITDPPYGVREPCKKIDRKRGATVHFDDNTQEERHGSEPDTRRILPSLSYSVVELEADLLTFAARSLQLGGRLLFWHLSATNTFHPSDLPTHPCMTVRYQLRQALNLRCDRHLIVFEKFRPWSSHPHNASLPETCTSNKSGNVRDQYFATGDVNHASGAYQSYLLRRARRREAVTTWQALNIEKVNDSDPPTHQ